MVCLILPCFSQLSRKRQGFLEKVDFTQNLIFSTILSQNFLISGRRQTDIITHAFKSSSKRQDVCPILSNSEFSPHISIEFLSLKAHDNPSGEPNLSMRRGQKFNADRFYSVSSKERRRRRR